MTTMDIFVAHYSQPNLRHNVSYKKIRNKYINTYNREDKKI